MTSKRLQRAAISEMQRLDKQRQRRVEIIARIEAATAARLAPIRLEVAELDDRINRLGQAADVAFPAARPVSVDPSRTAGCVLHGKRIRIEAVRAALRTWGVGTAHTIDEWYALFVEAGWACKTRAAFLTQLSRSPCVEKSTKPGVYALLGYAEHRDHLELRLMAALDAVKEHARPEDVRALRAAEKLIDEWREVFDA